MRLRVSSIGKEQFYKCIKYKLWGSNRSKLNDGENGFYPYRMPFDIIKVFDIDDGIKHDGPIKEAFLEVYGKNMAIQY